MNFRKHNCLCFSNHEDSLTNRNVSLQSQSAYCSNFNLHLHHYVALLSVNKGLLLFKFSPSFLDYFDFSQILLCKWAHQCSVLNIDPYHNFVWIVQLHNYFCMFFNEQAHHCILGAVFHFWMKQVTSHLYYGNFLYVHASAEYLSFSPNICQFL